MDHGDIVTASLTNINGASFGAIETLPGATTKVTPLMTSSDKAMLMDVSNIQGDPDPDAIAGKFKPDGKTYGLAARISGPRSEERRVGKEWVRTGRSWWSQYY